MSQQPDADDTCLFCQITTGEVAATEVARTERVVAFHDVEPQAPLHVLVVPLEHHHDVSELAATDPDLLAELVTTGSDVANELCDGQFRLVFNTGPASGQSIYHVHGHVLAGRAMRWPPG